MANLGESIELRFSRLARSMSASAAPIISLGLGEPDFPTPPEAVAAAHEAMRAGLTRYSSPFGIMDLRAAISDKFATENNVRVAADAIIVTSGAKMALSLALGAMLEAGDEVIVVTPCYPSYIPQVLIAEPTAVIRAVDVRRDDFSLDFDSLAGALSLRTKAVLLNSPHNPTGRMISLAEIERLAELLGERRCWVISDEVYERLNHSGTRHLSPGAHPALAGRTVTINGFSKTFAMTGWRIGYAAFPDARLFAAAGVLQQHMNTCVAPFIQKAALAALSLPSDFLDPYNHRLAENAEAVVRLAASNPSLSAPPSLGGLFAFVDISATGMGSDDLATALLEEESVAVTPGIVFGKGWDTHVRVSLAIDTGSFAEGIGRLDAFARRRTLQRDRR